MPTQKSRESRESHENNNINLHTPVSRTDQSESINVERMENNNISLFQDSLAY